MGKQRTGTSRGQALVELALLTPVLLLIVGGIIEAGLAFNTYLQLANASREGARAGILVPTETSAIRAATLRELPGGVASRTVVTVDCAPAGTSTWGSCLSVYQPARGDLIRVTTSYTYQPMLPPINGLTSFIALTMQTKTIMKAS